MLEVRFVGLWGLRPHAERYQTAMPGRIAPEFGLERDEWRIPRNEQPATAVVGICPLQQSTVTIIDEGQV